MNRDLYKLKSEIMDQQNMLRALARISHEIIERNKGVEEFCLVGIKRRGCSLADRIRDNIVRFEGKSVPCAAIDIGFYRDDLTLLSDMPLVRDASLPFSVTGQRVVLVDDVLYTGRTARAAMEAVLSAGRPRSIQLAVLIDRGHRELPIRADYVGKNIPTSHRERVAVHIPPYDEEMGVLLYE